MDLDQSSDDVRREIIRLASDLLDQQIDEAGRQRLESLMENDSDARAYFVDYMALHVLLEAMHEPALCQALDVCGDTVPNEAPFARQSRNLPQEYDSNRDSVTGRRIPRRSIGKLIAWGLAGCLLLANGLWLWAGRNETPKSPATFVGVLSKARGAQWTGSWAPDSIPAQLAAGQRLQLDSGTAEMTLNSGCTIVLKGPADLTLESSMRVKARYGTVRARVGDSAQGFVLETPTTTVVDLGTEFGVQVDAVSHSTDVVVFEGAVDLEVDPSGRHRAPVSSGVDSRRLTRLASGEALRIDRLGDTHRIISILSEQFPTAIDFPVFGNRRALIRNITDNIRDPRATAYYQIVGAGLREDSRAYVDRFHEWNGVDENGIPPFLLGADYVMCFNSDKWEKDLEITVDVAASVELFVFFDDRLPVPQWLSDQFTRTKYKIGIDEGYRDGSAPQVTTVGTGRSIDTVYSIWRKDVTESTQVRLGSLPKHIVEVSMYGIAAVPLEAVVPEAQAAPLPEEAALASGDNQAI